VEFAFLSWADWFSVLQLVCKRITITFRLLVQGCVNEAGHSEDVCQVFVIYLQDGSEGRTPTLGLWVLKEGAS